MVSTIILGVGIGVLAQPQLAVRFMTVKSKRELNRAVVLGGLFILLIPGTAYMVGSLSNAWFAKNGPLFRGVVARVIDVEKGFVELQRVEQIDGQWQRAGKPIPAILDRTSSATEPVRLDGESTELVAARTISIINAGGDEQQIMPCLANSPPGRGSGCSSF